MPSQATRFVRENGLFVLVLLVLLGAFVFLRTKGTKFASLDEFDALIASGQPVVVEFYGNT
jgi:cell division protein FtsW (lipid II flippase)